MPDPIRPTDPEAIALARRLIDAATHGALGTLARDGNPQVTRVGLATDIDGTPIALISALAAHFGALRAHPVCSMLIAEDSNKGDPLTHPRITLQCRARFLPNTDPALRDRFLTLRPKAKLYADLPDFAFVRFEMQGGTLNGGFARAYQLTADDLAP